MRLYPNQLKSHLNRTLQPAYLFSAEEPLLTQECRDAVIGRAKQQGFIEREILHLEKGFNWDYFYEVTANLSLFGDRKIVDLRFPTEKVDAKASKALLTYLEHPDPDTLLLITLSKLDSAIQRSKWFKAFDTQGAWLPIKPLTGRFFLEWLTERSRQIGLNCTPDAIKLIADRVEGNLLAAAQELEKLQLLLPNPSEAISEKHIRNAVANHARYDLFAWIDTLLVGNTTKALQMLHGLKAESGEPIILLWALSRELRVIITLKEITQQGTPIADAMQQQKVWKNRQPLIQKALSRVPLTTLHQLLALTHQVDLAIKGLIRKESPWRILENIVVIFCQPALKAQLTGALN